MTGSRWHYLSVREFLVFEQRSTTTTKKLIMSSCANGTSDKPARARSQTGRTRRTADRVACKHCEPVGVIKGSLSLFTGLDDLILSWSDYNKFMFSSKNEQPTPGFNLFTSLSPSFTPSPSLHSLRDLYKNEDWVENECLFLEMEGSSESGSAIFQSLDCFFFFFSLPSGFYPLLAKVLPWS